MKDRMWAAVVAASDFASEAEARAAYAAAAAVEATTAASLAALLTVIRELVAPWPAQGQAARLEGGRVVRLALERAADEAARATVWEEAAAAALAVEGL